MDNKHQGEASNVVKERANVVKERPPCYSLRVRGKEEKVEERGKGGRVPEEHV